MMKTQIGLGVLSIPMAFDTLGIVPGVLCLCAIAAVTTWSDYVIGTFKLNHREVYGIDDAAALMFGPIGRWALSVIFCLCMLPYEQMNCINLLISAEIGYLSAVPASSESLSR